MKKTKLNKIWSWYGIIMLSFILIPNIDAQEDTLCSPFENAYITSLSMVYGSSTNMSSSIAKSDFVAGQPVLSTQQLKHDAGYSADFGIL